MIRNTLFSSIRNRLNCPPNLLPEDFEISTSASRSNGVILEISYLCGDGEFFKVHIPNKKELIKTSYGEERDFKITLEVCPGELTKKEAYELKGQSELENQVSEWIKRLNEEIIDLPVLRLYEQQRLKIDELEKELDKIPNEYATKEQIDQIKEWVNGIEEELKGSVSKLNIDIEEKKAKIEEIEKELESIKVRTGSTKLKNIFRVLIGRSVKYASDPRLPALLENGKRILKLVSPENQ